MDASTGGRRRRRDPFALVGEACLRAFPARFRQRHGQDLIRLHRDLWARQRRPAAWLAALRMGLELIAQGLGARREQRRANRRRPLFDWEDAMDTLLQDLRFAFRMLIKRPGFAVVAVLSLGLGIGANATVFSMVNAFLLRPMPYVEPAELVHVWGLTRQGPRRVSVPNYLDWRERAATFEDMAAFNYTIETLSGGELPEQISGARVSANALDMLGVQPVIGRGFAAGEDSLAASPVVMLAEDFWEERYGRSEAVLGRTLEVDGTDYTIIGVVPEGTNFPLPRTELWMPRFLDDPDYTRDRAFLQVAARLADGVSSEAAAAEMESITAALEAEYPEPNDDLRAQVVPLRDALNFASDILGPMSVLLMAAAGFVLLIACANVGSLSLARALTREREIAVRAALGAGRRRILRQLFTESLLVAIAGGVVGLGVARFGTDALNATIPLDLYRVGDMGLDPAVILFTMVLSGLTAVVAGAVPALRSSRTDLIVAIKEGTAGAGTGRRSNRLQAFMVGFEMSLAIVLLVGTALMVRTLSNMQSVDTGFTRSGVLTMRMVLPDSGYGEVEARGAFHRALLERARSVPGVVAAATVNYLPLNHETGSAEFAVAGRSEPPTPLSAVYYYTSPDYFRVMEIPVVAGRGFTAADDRDAARVVVIDEVMRERYWPDEDPLGQTIRLLGSDREVTIVGVVGETKQVEISDERYGTMYLSMLQSPGGYLRLLARVEGDPAELVPAMRAEVAAVDPQLPISEIRTLDQVVDDYLLPQQMMVNALGVVAVGALALASIGVYGLMAFFVSQRLRDIGIHVALGATRTDVRKMLVGRVLKLSALGVGVGLLGAFGVVRLMSGLLYGVSAADPLAFAGSTAFLVGVAVTAGLMGARRAVAADPVQTLRSD